MFNRSFFFLLASIALMTFTFRAVDFLLVGLIYDQVIFLEFESYYFFHYLQSAEIFGLLLAGLIAYGWQNLKILSLLGVFAMVAMVIALSIQEELGWLSADLNGLLLLLFYLFSGFYLAAIFSWGVAVFLEQSEKQRFVSLILVVLAFQLSDRLANNFVFNDINEIGQSLTALWLISLLALAFVPRSKKAVVASSDRSDFALAKWLLLLATGYWLLRTVIFLIDSNARDVFAASVKLFDPFSMLIPQSFALIILLAFIGYLVKSNQKDSELSTFVVFRFSLIALLASAILLSPEALNLVSDEIGFVTSHIFFGLTELASSLFFALVLFVIAGLVLNRQRTLIIAIWLVIISSLRWLSFEFYDLDGLSIRVILVLTGMIGLVVYSQQLQSLFEAASRRESDDLQFDTSVSADKFSLMIGLQGNYIHLLNYSRLLLRLACVFIIIFGFESAAGSGLFAHLGVCQNIEFSVFIAIAEVTIAYFLFLGSLTRIAGLVLIFLCWLQINYIDGLYLVNSLDIDKQPESLILLGWFAFGVVFLGPGRFSLHQFFNQPVWKKRSLIATVLATSLLSGFVFVSLSESANSLRTSGYSYLQVAPSDASSRSYQIITGTGQLLKEINKGVILPYYGDGYQLPNNASDLVFLNQYIERDYPAVDYRVLVNDYWGTSYRFSWITNEQYELRSAGPDRVMDNTDDINLICSGDCELYYNYRGRTIFGWISNGELSKYGLRELQSRAWRDDDSLWGEVAEPPTDSCELTDQAFELLNN